MTRLELEPSENGAAKTKRPRRNRRLEPVAIRLDGETLARLRELAQERGIGPTTLARMWILEHLQEEKGHPSREGPHIGLRRVFPLW